ncbi:hypothetical protein [Anoxynatronum buryatiense]|uniref:CoA binding domain-containing protein n=1 Tax=Anoxynatronum buryatiense TaxID=489973 RepID=A0AA45WVF7_9CLOT|nr:hypothetical protein [Anoxynatronum buryatiense]SMP52672.1 CoA binding domain-containing protein [Anoxynatronum buryatiense]
MKQLLPNFLEYELYKTAVEYENEQYGRVKQYYLFLVKWLTLITGGGKIEDCLLERGYNTIAIYGYGEIGKLLIRDLSQTSKIKIDFIVDNGATHNNDNSVPIYHVDQLTPELSTALIIVTPIFAYDQIEKDLNEKGCEKIMCIDELI